MSGDVQPRKRRDKKKKKEDVSEEGNLQHTTAIPTPIPSEELNIHVQKDASTGGGFCAKFIFFILLIVLSTITGLIITEHRGLTELDTIDTESRFAQLFEGWIDKPSNDNDSPEELSLEELDPHVIDEEEEYDDDDEKEEDEEEDDEEEYEATSEDKTEELEIEEADSNIEEDTLEDDSEEELSELQEEEIEDGAEDDEEPSEEPYISEEPEEEEEEEKSLPVSKSESINQDDYREDEEYEDTKDEDQDDSEEFDDKTESEEVVVSSRKEKIILERKRREDKIKTQKYIQSKENSKLQENDESEEMNNMVEENTLNPLEESDNYNMVVKFGVGAALLVVAHVVLIQKWRTTEKVIEKKSAVDIDDSDPPDLSRRNTIVPPPNLAAVQQDIENLQEEYSEDDEDSYSEEEENINPALAKRNYQELQSTYSHTLSPDWEPREIREIRKQDNDEEDEEVEGDDDYDDEISENEDAELLKRLEEKYGRVQQRDDDDEYDEVEEEEEEEEEVLEEEEDEEYPDNVDGFDSWKHVNVPYDDVLDDTDSENEKSSSERPSGARTTYDFSNITNTNDWKIREELDRAREHLEKDAAYALTLFNTILERNALSPRGLYGKAQSLDVLAEKKRSNVLLQQAIDIYQQVLSSKDVPDLLFQIVAERCIDRIRFRGLYNKAVPIHKLLIEKFPEIPRFRNQLVVTYLTGNKITEAREYLKEILSASPDDGFALVHYGFILKTIDDNLKDAVGFLKKGIETKTPDVIDGRFYFHLGDALTRLGRKNEAMDVYSDGVENKVFLSKYQRSLYNVDRLQGKPWWTKDETLYTKFFEQLEKSWTSIRDEGLSILNKKGFFQPEAENLRDVGDWKQFELYARGVKNAKNCEVCPITCHLVEMLPDAIGCRRGQIKFSVMHPGTHVWPHCGPTNCRLRAHLGLKVPLNTFIRVGTEIRSWKNGKLLIFDDSFEHEVWHNGTSTRLVLIVDVWHPELTTKEKNNLSSI